MTDHQLIVYNKIKKNYQLIVLRNEVYDIDFHSPRNEVIFFLDKVRHLLSNNANFIFIKNRRKEKENPKYTTETCLFELEYDNIDVINEICSLSLEHYYQTLFDDKGRGTQPLFIFIKKIQNKQVYIKIKLKENDEGEKVVCISFHFAEYEVKKLPYVSQF